MESQIPTKPIGTDYQMILKRLGNGSFASVYQGYHNTTHLKVAIKAIQSTLNGIPFKIVDMEIEILKTVKSPNIVRLIDFYKIKNKNQSNSLDERIDYFLILELCQKSLADEIQQRKQNKQHYTESEILNILNHICNGYKILLQNKIIHRDIKPANILILQKIYKLADFGFGRMVANLDEISQKTNAGSPAYASPQIRDNKGYSSKCDIWSLGVLLFELMYFKLPFTIKTSNQLRTESKNSVVFPNQPQYSQELKQVLTSMLKQNEEDRIDWCSLFTHNILKRQRKTKIVEEESLTKDQFQFEKQVSDYVLDVAEKLELYKSSLKAEIYFIGAFSLYSYNIYFCEFIIEYLYSKQPPFKKLGQSQQVWDNFKDSKCFWEIMKYFKKNIKTSKTNIVQSFLDRPSVQKNVDPNIIKAAKSLCQKKDNKQSENEEPKENKSEKIKQLLTWFYEEIKNNKAISEVLLKNIQIIKNDPNKPNNDFEQLRQELANLSEQDQI